jgi:hypothetical protein
MNGEGGMVHKERRWLDIPVFAFAVLIGAMSVYSCANESVDPGAPYVAPVLVLNPAQTAGEPATFSLEEKKLETLFDLANMNGSYFQILGGGELSLTDINGSQVQDPEFTGGGAPLLRYTVEDGVLVPRDYTTLALLSAFYQYELVFKNMQSLIGLSADDYLALNGKMKILFEPAIVQNSSGASANVVIKLNAAFLPGKEQFVLFRRSAVEKVPIALNLQVIAHEFGHAAFEQSFYKNVFDPGSRFSKETAILGINEGFADILSWAMTGSADILRGSIDIDSVADARNFANLRYTFADLLASSLVESEAAACSGSFYCIGSLFASSVLKARDALGLTNSFQDRTAVSQAVYAALQGTQDTLSVYLDSVRPEIGVSDEPSVDLSARDGQFVGAFLRAFTQNLREDWRPVFCETFIENFGFLGFGQTAREGVCL